MDRVLDITRILPEECIGRIISATSPPDACRLSLVSRVFRSAATSNLMWERFLPPEYEQIISEAVSTSSLPLSTLPKKDLFFHLCDNPILIGNGNMSFAMEKLYGKKCYMLAAREIAIIWGEDPHHWKWIPSVESPFSPKSRFSEVAYLVDVRYLDLQGKIESKMLSKYDVRSVLRPHSRDSVLWL
ncbi:putative F-box protein PP2-B12 [Morella rubra]|uniref:Putative F-box protein PP2-B12 n=1 Tax=Morella rubra TaxID=262757 RepID=A0A6A1UMX8_9ROSI|nr:putative F-box protein PP2-B12 [Morella rubra]